MCQCWCSVVWHIIQIGISDLSKLSLCVPLYIQWSVNIKNLFLILNIQQIIEIQTEETICVRCLCVCAYFVFISTFGLELRNSPNGLGNTNHNEAENPFSRFTEKYDEFRRKRISKEIFFSINLKPKISAKQSHYYTTTHQNLLIKIIKRCCMISWTSPDRRENKMSQTKEISIQHRRIHTNNVRGYKVTNIILMRLAIIELTICRFDSERTHTRTHIISRSK